MGVVVAPYNPWKQNIAAQIGMMLGQHLLEKSSASAANEKVAAFLGEVMQGVDPTYENAAVQNEIIARQNAANGGFAGAPTPVGAVPPPMAAGGPGAPGGGIPVEAVAAAMGAAPPQGGYNIAAVDPRSQQMIPGAMRPDGMLGRAPVTPMIDVVKALQLAATPRFAPYASALFKTVNDLVGMNTTMRENAYKDFDTNKRGQVGAWQSKLAGDIATGGIGERDGRNIMAAIGSFIGNPMEYSANQERTEATDRGSILDYEGRKYAADQSLKGSLANAARPVYGGGGGYQPYDGTKRDAMTFFTTTERDTFNQLIKGFGPGPTPEQVATARQEARDEANRQTAKMYPDSPFAAEFNRAENEKRDVAEFTAMAMGNQDFSKALSDAARQGEAAVRRVASQALLPNGKKPTATQIESLVRTIMGQVEPSSQGDTQKTPQMPYKGA